MQPFVALLGEQQAARRGAIASGPAGLLVVGLEGARHGGVAHGPHVGLVDPHPEGVGGDDHRASPDMNRSWVRARTPRSSPAW